MDDYPITYSAPPSLPQLGCAVLLVGVPCIWIGVGGVQSVAHGNWATALPSLLILTIPIQYLQRLLPVMHTITIINPHCIEFRSLVRTTRLTPQQILAVYRAGKEHRWVNDLVVTHTGGELCLGMDRRNAQVHHLDDFLERLRALHPAVRIGEF